MNSKIHWVSSLLVAGVLFYFPFAATAATCKDSKSCNELTSKVSSPLADRTVNSLTTDIPQLKQSLTLSDKALVSEQQTQTGTISINPKFDPSMQDQLKLVNNECSPLRWTDERTVELPQQIVADPRERGPDAGVADAIGIIVQPPNSTYESLGFNTNILSPVEVGNPVSIILNPPTAITGAQMVGSLPGNLQFDYLNGKMAIYTPCKNGLPTNLMHPSTTTYFDLRVISANSSTAVVLDTVLPVSLHSQAIIQVLNPGNQINRDLEFSGGPLSCAGLPSGVACGPVSWSYQPNLGGPMPQGINLQSLSNGHGQIAGTVQDSAYSSIGKIHLTQQQSSFETDAIFEVPVNLTQVQLSQLAELNNIERGEVIDIRLPQPRGGDGQNYVWRLDYYSDLLPDGLSLIGDRITGMVTDGANIGDLNLDLIVRSTLHPSIMNHPEIHAPMSFRLTVPFSLWTQNSFMRPPDLPAIVHDSIHTTLDIVGSVIGTLICGLPCAAGGLLTAGALDSELAEAIENAWDNGVQNTTADNAERMAHIIDRVNLNSFDIVALQEVFQFDPALNNGNTLPHISQINNALGAQYDILDGPVAAGIEMNSGLKLLARKSLSPSPAYGHVPQVFQNDPVLLTDSNGNQQFNIDALAQKGMTIDRIQFGPNVDEYAYVVNTHMQAQAGPLYDNLRSAQQNEMFNFISQYSDSAHPVLIIGDFNVTEANGSGWSRLQTNQYSTLLGNLGLTPNDDLFRSYQNNTGNDDGFTVNPTRNAYGLNWGDSNAIERLDYILLRQGSQYQIEADSVEMTDIPANTTLCSNWLSTSQPNLQCYLSDHFGLSAELRLVKN